MSSRETMSSPCDTVVGLFRGLHPITQGLIGVVALHLFATVVSIMGQSTSYGTNSSPYELTGRLVNAVRSVSYSLLMLGTPANVEFLYRISVEVRLMRLAKSADTAGN